MNYLFSNDQALIADGLLMNDELNSQTARLAHFKITYYKFTLIRPSFKLAKEELRCNIRNSLFNFNTPSSILDAVNFYTSELEN
jgi:hypothetical protein